MDTPANQIPSFGYSVSPMNIGEGYAAGIEQAGKGIAAGIGSALDTMTQNRTADDTLAAMHQSKMLSDDAYKAVAGKSLGAKQQLLGMYASQWIAAQAQNRELEKLGYQGNVDVDVAHRKLLDTVGAIQGKYGPGGAVAAGVNVTNLPIGSYGTGAGQPGNPPAVQRAQLVQNPTALQAARAATTNPALAAPGQPLGTATSTPDVIIGAPYDPTTPIPQGAQPGMFRGQRVIKMPDGKTIRPIIQSPQTATTGQIMSGGV